MPVATNDAAISQYVVTIRKYAFSSVPGICEHSVGRTVATVDTAPFLATLLMALFSVK